MTIKQIKIKNSTLPILDLDLILAQALGKPKEFLYSNPEFKLSLKEYLVFKYYLNKLKHGWPVAYILKNKEFFGLNFYVNKNVLIPRPETETLVSLALDELKTQDLRFKIIIDIGTGSGCIPISILKNLQSSVLNYQCLATDISRPALRIARQNSKRHNVKINFLHSNLLSPVIKTLKHENIKTREHKNIKTILITANLPYLTSSQMSEPSIKREPKTALYGGPDGLELYKKLLKQIATLISNFQFPISVYLEIDPSQSASIISLINQYFPQAKVEIKKDLCGLSRVVKILNLQS